MGKMQSWHGPFDTLSVEAVRPSTEQTVGSELPQPCALPWIFYLRTSHRKSDITSQFFKGFWGNAHWF